MAMKTVTFNKAGFVKAPINKPVVYQIKTAGDRRLIPLTQVRLYVVGWAARPSRSVFLDFLG